MFHLIGEYYLTADPNCYIIGKPLERRGKGIEMKSARYFTTLPAAVSAAVNLALRDKIQTERIQSLEEAVDEMQRLKAELETAVSRQMSEQG